MNNPIFVSYIDDPRITLDMALSFEKVQDEFWEEGENEFLENTLKSIQEMDDSNILFPILDTHSLRERFIQILCFHKVTDYEFFNHNSFLQALFKSALRFSSARIEFSTDSFGKYGNPELQMVLEMYHQVLRTDCRSFFEGVIGYSYDELKTGDFSDLEKRMSSFIAGTIWTQTNIGNAVHSSARKKSSDIIEKINIKNCDGMYFKRLQKKSKFVEATIINEDDFYLSKPTLSALFKLEQNNIEPLKTVPHSLKMDCSNEYDIVFNLVEIAKHDDVFSNDKLLNLSVETLQHADFINHETFVVSIDDVKYKLNFKNELNIVDNVKHKL